MPEVIMFRHRPENSANHCHGCTCQSEDSCSQPVKSSWDINLGILRMRTLTLVTADVNKKARGISSKRTLLLIRNQLFLDTNGHLRQNNALHFVKRAN